MTQQKYRALLYKDKKHVFEITVLDYFSIALLFNTLYLVIYTFVKSNLPRQIIFTTRFLPFQRFKFVKNINSFLFIKILRIFFQNNSSFKTVWIMSPEIYLLHNFLKWKFLVFDFEKIKNLKNHHFFENVFMKKNVYVYDFANSKIPPQLFSVHKDIKDNYKKQIWEYINNTGN